MPELLDRISENQIEPYIDGRFTEAPKTGVVELDQHLRFKKNQVTIIGGAANTGKTHGWLWVLFTWAKYLESQPKFLLMTNENDNVEMKVLLIEFYCEKYLNKCTREEIKTAWKWVEERFAFMPQNYKTNLEQVLYTAQDIKKTTGDFNGVFLDPYNSLQTASYYEHYDNASRMRGFVKKQGVNLYVSMHVLSEAQRTRDKDGNIRVPHVAQLEHGSMWFNRADDAVVIHRQTQNADRKYVTELHVQKIKHTRSGGETTNHDTPIELKYDFNFGGFEWVTKKDKAGF